MSPEDQNRVIAEACGWREAFPKNGPPHPETKRGGILLPYYWVNEKTHERETELPDYLSDLNAMHEAEKMLQDKCKYWPDYVDELVRLVSDGYPRLPHQKREDNWSQTVHATAAQRAEAYLRTIGKWKD